MNLAFNAVMWGLFTRALTLASSTVRVSVINTSANFMLTAVMGFLIFSESLPGIFTFAPTPPSPSNFALGLWWLGAAMLVAGSVIIGRREEGQDTASAGTTGVEHVALAQQEYTDEPDAPPPSVGNHLKANSISDEREAYLDSDDIELESKSSKRGSDV